CTRRNEEADVW
nr:immunoglobulin heavy chain junction region [Macaca mulatta]MOY17920.1 immunoglobulin heavy chain junction region [Macaca mulatta]MOY17995.1 immunoglobulin heavy chain junction region [Macaca mulatta]MOY18021.1 immunoglobulin heavy chain junction region [Macaca mulatta]MOY18072.1 immunoglobulin heavy chain junction region [Macaca mulatta]